MEQIYAKILLPLEDYSTEQAKLAMQDPLYRDFIEFKDELVKKLEHSLEKEKTEDENDTMFKSRQEPTVDCYFGDDDGNLWGHSGLF